MVIIMISTIIIIDTLRLMRITTLIVGMGIIVIRNKRAIVALNRSHVLCAPVLFSGGDDLNHLVEGNQAGLFECITGPYPLPSSHTKIFYIPKYKALAFVVSDKKVFSCFP